MCKKVKGISLGEVIVVSKTIETVSQLEKIDKILIGDSELTYTRNLEEDRIMPKVILVIISVLVIIILLVTFQYQRN